MAPITVRSARLFNRVKPQTGVGGSKGRSEQVGNSRLQRSNNFSSCHAPPLDYQKFFFLEPASRNGQDRDNDKRVPESTSFAINAVLTPVTFNGGSLSGSVKT